MVQSRASSQLTRRKTMKKSLSFVFALALLALPGCKKIVTVVLDLVGSLMGVLEGIWNSIAASAMIVAEAKYMPTEWYWWVMAGISIVALWLPMRPKTQMMMIYICRKIMYPTIAVFLWGVMKGSKHYITMGIVIVIVLVVFKLLSSVKSKLTSAKDGAKDFMNFITLWGDKAVEAAEKGAKAKGLEAEKSAGAEEVALAAISLVSTVIVMAVLFGGDLYPKGVNRASIGQHIDFVLRLIGIVFFVVSSIRGFKDLNARWTCEKCGLQIWDLNLNKEFCPNPECQHPNPRVVWTCSCGQVNSSSENPYRCGGASCNQKGRKGLLRKWAELSEPGENCQKCGKKVGDDDLFCPNQDCKFPNPKKEWECHNQDCGNDNPGTSLTCKGCGMRRRKLATRWHEEANREANPHTPPVVARVCPHCKVPVPDGNPFCSGCGKPMEGRICPDCKIPVADGNPFCSGCGRSIG